VDKKILDKIKKCLRLAMSSNANEAATALRQAKKLMELHGISADEVAASDVESHSTKSGAGNTPPNHIAMLVDLVSTAFGVQAVYSKRLNPNNFAFINVVEFFGIGSSAEISSYAYEVLLRQLKRDRTAFLKTIRKSLKQSTKVRRADMYCQGWVLAVSEKITPHQRTEKELNAVAKYKEKRFSNNLVKKDPIDRTKKAKSHDHSSFSDGLRDGEKVDFNQGVSGTKQKALSND
jgi:hypothetical protein